MKSVPKEDVPAAGDNEIEGVSDPEEIPEPSVVGMQATCTSVPASENEACCCRGFLMLRTLKLP